MEGERESGKEGGRERWKEGEWGRRGEGERETVTYLKTQV